MMTTLLFASTLVAPLQSPSVEATIDAAKTSAPISKYVYGQFIEHIGNLMTAGLWAEMLDDRKFFNPVPGVVTPPATGRAARTRLRPWTAIGPVSAISMDRTRAYTGKASPKVTLAAEPRGFTQAGLGLVAGKAYVGRVVLAGSPQAKVSVSLVWGEGTPDRRAVTLGRLGENYRKYPLRFEVPANADNARLEITGVGEGSYHVGAVSLMPADNVEGFRPEVVKVLKSLRSGVYRFPGGNFVSAHEWRDAIGDIDRRPPKFDPVWSAVQSNDLGTDEFMRFCRLIEVDPYISVSAGFGDAQSAKAYVEYCNSAPNTPMGRLRAQNGHRAPYAVKYWGIGNETWGYSYQFGAMKLDQYVVKHNDFAEAMLSADPTIKLIGSGAMPDTMTGSGESLKLGDTLIPKPLGPGDWTGGLFKSCLGSMDLISEHFYNYGATHYDLAQGRQVPNDPNEPLVTWMRRPANHVRIKVEEYQAYEKLIPGLKQKPVPICLDEWAYSGGPANSFRTAPALAWTFHEMFRNSDLYQMACYTFGTSLYTANRTEAVLNPAGMVFKFYRDHFGAIPVAVNGNSPQPKPTDPPGGEQPEVNAGSPTFPLDIAAAWSEDRKTLSVAVINPTETEQTVDLKIANASLSGGTLWRMAPGYLDAVVAVGGRKEVSVDSSAIPAMPSRLTLPKHSISIYVLTSKP